jgi:iron complex transport system substrate-binding protein
MKIVYQMKSSRIARVFQDICLYVIRCLAVFLLSAVCLVIPASAAAGTPKRIISLAPNITEILFAVGLGDRVIGVTSFCDYPSEARGKPKVGGMSNPSLEAVVSLKPDIVMMTTDGNPKDFAERLRSLRIKTYVFKARRLSELPQGIRDMGIALGVREKAAALAGEIESSMSNFSRLTPHASRKPKVLFIVWPEPLIVAGPGTSVDDAISLLGAENIASKAVTEYPKYSMEEIIRQDPDVIFIGKGHADMRDMSKGLIERIAVVRAVKKGDVFFLSDSLYRLGPRVTYGIEEMAKCLR